MTTRGIEAVLVETHDWGRSVRFFQSLGYTLEFETDHHSGQLRSAEGPYLFVAEVPEDQPAGIRLGLRVDDAATFVPGDGVEVVSPFEPTHWGTEQMLVRDPDGRAWSVEAPARS